uniref:Uncharacterized protein n=1 Tax=Anopheles albimanus TaxID=7167 RepID=A0A182FWV2_ANOAL
MIDYHPRGHRSQLGHFHSLWLHRIRDLNLLQKVVLLNTFLLPKLWYVASVCSARAKDIAKVTSIIGAVLSNGSGGIRVPLQQLAQPRHRGGLNLHVPAINTAVLLTNRYVKEQRCLAIGRQHIAWASNPPDLVSVPSSYPYCMPGICSAVAQNSSNDPFAA